MERRESQLSSSSWHHQEWMHYKSTEGSDLKFARGPEQSSFHGILGKSVCKLERDTKHNYTVHAEILLACRNFGDSI